MAFLSTVLQGAASTHVIGFFKLYIKSSLYFQFVFLLYSQMLCSFSPSFVADCWYASTYQAVRREMLHLLTELCKAESFFFFFSLLLFCFSNKPLAPDSCFGGEDTWRDDKWNRFLCEKIKLFLWHQVQVLFNICL